MLVTLLQEKTKKAIQDKNNNLETLANELFEQCRRHALSAAGQGKSICYFLIDHKYNECKKLFEQKLDRNGLQWKVRQNGGRLEGWEYTISWAPAT